MGEVPLVTCLIVKNAKQTLKNCMEQANGRKRLERAVLPLSSDLLSFVNALKINKQVDLRSYRCEKIPSSQQIM